LQKMIRAADRDGSGSVEFNEFMNMMCKNIEVSLQEFCQI
jgi:Ca2+-binding EF-hand superfamily protein